MENQYLLASSEAPVSFAVDGRRSGLVLREDKPDGTRRYELAGQQTTVEVIIERDAKKRLVRLHSILRTKKRCRVSDVAILDVTIEDSTANKTWLYGISGGFASLMSHMVDDQAASVKTTLPSDALRPWLSELSPGDTYLLKSDYSGRSSNSQVPIWVYGDTAGGVWFGPEWSGSWSLTIGRADTGSRLCIGLPTFDFVLEPGEEVRLPAVLMGGYDGGIDEGRNRLRGVVLHDVIPCIGGRRPVPPVLFQGLMGLPSYQNEETLYRELERAAQIGCEAFILDAGWNQPPATTEWWRDIGSWVPDPSRFPSGFDRFAAQARRLGLRIGLWIEPRANVETALYRDHPELFLVQEPLRGPDGEVSPLRMALIDLSQAAARDLFEAELEQLIGYGADWIWFDFNLDPRSVVWNRDEDADRRGLLELGFYQGLYEVLDRILSRHPHVWLETCASGGRLIDLGMLRRSHSIWVNDSSHDDDINRNIRGGCNSLLPAVLVQSALFLNKEAITDPVPFGATLGGSHRFITCFGGVFQFGQGLTFWSEMDLAAAEHAVAVYKDHRHFLEADFHQLLPMPATRAAWDAWQYHDSETSSGILLVFRLQADTKTSAQILKPRGIAEFDNYYWSVVLGEGTIKVGDVLEIGLPTPGAVLVSYCPRTKLAPNR